MQRYGSKQLAEAPARHDAVPVAHAAHFVALGLEAELELVDPERAAWLDRLAKEHDNLWVVLDRLIAEGEVEPGVRLADALF